MHGEGMGAGPHTVVAVSRRFSAGLRGPSRTPPFSCRWLIAGFCRRPWCFDRLRTSDKLGDKGQSTFVASQHKKGSENPLVSPLFKSHYTDHYFSLEHAQRYSAALLDEMDVCSLRGITVTAALALALALLRCCVAAPG